MDKALDMLDHTDSIDMNIENYIIRVLKHGKYIYLYSALFV
jgi:hypothetical protein